MRIPYNTALHYKDRIMGIDASLTIVGGEELGRKMGLVVVQGCYLNDIEPCANNFIKAVDITMWLQSNGIKGIINNGELNAFADGLASLVKEASGMGARTARLINILPSNEGYVNRCTLYAEVA